MAHRDDLIVNDNYSLQATHSEEEGKIARKEIYKVRRCFKNTKRKKSATTKGLRSCHQPKS
jgi:hypothetical protein